jgi:xylulokinase
MYLLGYDVGSSSVKVTLLDGATGEVVAAASSPETEMPISAPRPGWAEQDPALWWKHLAAATARVRSAARVDLRDVAAIGLSYQMHGLVVVDGAGTVLRPSIIWCDSRAVEIGDRAFFELGSETCFDHLLNSPGNFTASKLKWVKENEPDIYRQIHKAMLPGDYIAFRMTGELRTTPSGLSEGMLWDYRDESPCRLLLDHYGLPEEMLPEIVPTFSRQGELTREAAEALGLRPGIPLTYRAGDQPNNALSLNVLQPGEIAATAGTSGIVYGVTDRPLHDSRSRVNTFLHVNHAPDRPRYGVILCINGTGILNSWLRNRLVGTPERPWTYEEMNNLAMTVPPGSDGLTILPYGNGAERTLGNRDPGASIHGLRFNTHTRAHWFRAAQEGIVFALQYGLGIMKQMGMAVGTVRAGHANLFLSPLFGEAFATVTGCRVELFNTDGSQGAARGAGIGAGFYETPEEAFTGLRAVRIIEPRPDLAAPYQEAWTRWLTALESET